MDMSVSNDAAVHMKRDMEVENGASIRFFVRYGGCGNIQTGFSLGVAIDEPVEAAASAESEGVIFYVEDKDSWYFGDRPFYVEWDEAAEEIAFRHGELV
ncbi:HesB/YadR/YfhF family protein [Alkalicoccus luteus]|uniref:HesB/YadR/YfhF family protein n=1 Tax=Alkalicoccus luteus TaxID=1237094 RepID=UPI00197B30C9|nr:hypothetical protein [Alkalicoccus luteus]